MYLSPNKISRRKDEGNKAQIVHFLKFIATMHVTTVQPEIFAWRNFLPISPPDLVGENFYQQIFSPVLMNA